MEQCKIVMKPKILSFTTYEKTCEFHDATDNRVCYCRKTGETCNKMNCWKFMENGE